MTNPTISQPAAIRAASELVPQRHDRLGRQAINDGYAGAPTLEQIAAELDSERASAI